MCCFLFCSESILAEGKGVERRLVGKNNDRKGWGAILSETANL